MKLYLQFGHGMMEHSRSLLSRWKGGSVILSPRDLGPAQIVDFAKAVGQIPDGQVLLDPQFYLPHSNFGNLTLHDYWPKSYSTGGFWQGGEVGELVQKIATKNAELNTSAVLLPGLLASVVDDDWLYTQDVVIKAWNRVGSGNVAYGTIALSADATRDASQIERLIECAEKWRLPGYYVVSEHPSGDYFVQDPMWMTNLLDLAAGLRLLGSKVIFGYCNQQMLLFASVKASAIASGTWMNVRAFPPSKFSVPLEEATKRRSKWYYCPQSLSEFKIPSLDLAHRQGVLGSMAPSKGYTADFSGSLFAGGVPTSSGFSEQAAFRHYLDCLRTQVMHSQCGSFDETIDRQKRLLDSAEKASKALGNAGVRGDNRSFLLAVEVNRSALDALVYSRGPILRRKWSVLGE